MELDGKSVGVRVNVTGRERRLQNGQECDFYRIDVSINGGYSFSILRRFSQFVTLDLALARIGCILVVRLPSRGWRLCKDTKFLRARAAGLGAYVRCAAALVTPSFRCLVDQFLSLESLRPVMLAAMRIRDQDCESDEDFCPPRTAPWARHVHNEHAMLLRLLSHSCF
ncbi:hypothetical protein KFE25_014027 [Diacronema lutheri]|uniref:PX domain-containing protein n=1 Tax=Diacronema lutheri TaxID=2081491 RepID=A0A8J6CBZ8_DIALT|nr:hypothetical protein KFE25_014027 [Diacronema lutheri]